MADMPFPNHERETREDTMLQEWRTWRGAIEARLGNVEHSVNETNTRLAVIEASQQGYIESVRAIRDYFDGQLRRLNEHMTGIVLDLRQVIERHAARIEAHDANAAKLQGGLAVGQALLPLIYGLIGVLLGAVGWYLFAGRIKP